MWTIRSLIFYRLILLLTLCFGVMSVGLFFTAKKIIRDLARRDNTRVVQFVSENFETQYISRLKVLDEFARYHRASPLAEVKASIREFLSYSQNAYSTLYLFSPEGQLIYGYKRDQKAGYHAETQFEHRTSQPIVQMTREVATSQKTKLMPETIDNEGEVFQTYLVPIIGVDGKTSAVLSGAVFPKRHSFSSALAGLPLAASNFVVVTSQRGRVIGGSGREDVIANSVLQNEMAKLLDPSLAFAGSRVRVQLGDKQEESYLLYSSTLPSVQFRVVLGVAESLIAETERHVIRALFYFLIFGFIVSLFISYFVGKRVVGPIRILAKKVENLNRGVFVETRGYKAKDEFGHILSLLNGIGRKIEKGKVLGELWSRENDEKETRG